MEGKAQGLSSIFFPHYNSQLLLVLQKCTNGAVLLRWTLTPSPQRVAKSHSRAILGNNRLLLLRSEVGRSMFEKMGETFQKNSILLWCQPSREQYKKLDYFWLVFQMTSCISLTDKTQDQLSNFSPVP